MGKDNIVPQGDSMGLVAVLTELFFALTAIGAKLNTAPDATPFVNNEDISNKTPPCPPFCGSL